MKTLWVKAILIFFLSASCIYSQISEQIIKYRADSYGDHSARRMGILDGNKVRTIFLNDGEIGYWPDRPSGEWPNGSGHSNLDGSCIMFGAEFTAPGDSQVVHSVEGSYREEVDFDPITGKLWVLNPIPGYANPNSETPALNNKPDSWPAFWPKALFGIDDSLNGRWYGLNNNSKSVGNVESFFVMDDSKDYEYTKFPYSFYPVKSDTNRGGLGLRIECREIQSSLFPVENVLFNKYDIYNISDYDYLKFVVGIFIDPGIGGLDDNSDDSAGYIQGENLVFAFDKDGISSHNWKTGYLGVAFLKTPLNNLGAEVGLNNVTVDVLSNKGPYSIFLKNDEYLWSKLTQNSFTGTDLIANIQFIMGTELFELKSGSHKQITSAFILGNSLDEILVYKYSAEIFCRNEYLPSAFDKLSVGISNLPSLKEIKGDTEIDYEVSNSSSQNLVAALFVSADGNDFQYYKTDNSFSGKFVINSNDFADGIFYKFKIVCYDKQNYGEFTTPDYVVINNAGNVPPQLKFISPNHVLTSFKDNLTIMWESGDADSDPFQTEIYYGNNSGTWKLLYKTIESGILQYSWDITALANSNSYILKAVLKSQSDSSVFYSSVFSISNSHKVINGKPYAEAFKSHGSGDFLFSIINSLQFSNERYSLKFVKLADSVSKGYTVKDLSQDKILIQPTLLQKNTESDLFDGIRLIINDDDREEILPDSAKWISGKCNYLVSVVRDQSSPGRDVFQPADYKITFSNFPVYTTPFQKLPLNFTIINTITNQPVDCELYDNDANRVFSSGDDVVLIEYIGGSTNFNFTWRIKFRNPINDTPIAPKEGDVFAFASTKPFQVGDEIIFSTVDVPVGVTNNYHEIPARFNLSQNFPNPFNPSTIIEYEIPFDSKVEIIVYDVLGRTIKTLVNEVKPRGRDSVLFNPDYLPSGIYFYRLTTPYFSQTKKMIYLK